MSGVWRTVGGRRIFIKDGQNLFTAMKESGKFKRVDIEKNKEYNSIDSFKCLKKYQNMSDEEYKKSYSSKNDYIMEEMAHENGFDGLPKKVSNAEYNKLIETGNIRVQRVVNDDANNTSEFYANGFKNGKYYATNTSNMYGNGIYTSGNTSDIEVYSSRSGKSKTIEMIIDKNLKIKNFHNQQDIFKYTVEELKKIDSKYQRAMENPGRILMSQGYDVAYIRNMNYYIIYNRSCIYVKE